MELPVHVSEIFPSKDVNILLFEAQDAIFELQHECSLMEVMSMRWVDAKRLLR